MTKQEYDNAIKKLDAEIWTAFSSEQVNEIAEKKDEINSQYISSLESQNAQLTAELAKTQRKINAIPAFLQAVKYYWSRVRTGEYTDVKGGQSLTNMAIDKFIALIGMNELPIISGDDSEYDYRPEQFGAEFGGAE